MITQVQQNSIRINIADRGIKTIDLEVEMVGHISSAVEDKMDQALNRISLKKINPKTIIETAFGLIE